MNQVIEENAMNQSDGSNQQEDQISLPNQMRCFAHLLNLLASTDLLRKMESNENELKILKKLMNKLQKFWNLSRRSSLIKDLCSSICGCVFPVPNQTRWNATYDAIKKVLEKKATVISFEINLDQFLSIILCHSSLMLSSKP